MADLVSFNFKHIGSNGENNCDGSSDDLSWNCGTEGPTSDLGIEHLRMRQIKNFAALLLLSHGVPMLLYEDEVRRSQCGNNNAYCQDELSRMNWDLVRENRSLLTVFKYLIEFRRMHSCLRRGTFVPMPGNPLIQMEWHGAKLGSPDWGWDSHSLALHLCEFESHVIRDSIYLISNAHWLPSQFELPQIEGRSWARFLDTSLEAPSDIAKPGFEAILKDQKYYAVAPRSTVVLVGGALK
jgi:glycogen operon protein